ncbi:MAG: tRNA (adenosine(37)-N6)-dimethylallyltransferase MiaA [Dehalococcoidales bacterium]|nr:tRNA (adenosine(37)-N6)-dimethylallyltransferase MiaA [Dehalococcoidales bacterium]
MNHLVVIVGPTAIGKSRLAIRLAEVLGGEIVSADSRQVYRFMDIGTAKPSPEELALVPHHLIGVINPDEDFGLAQYQEMAYQAISDVQERRKLALLVGGSGQYVWSLVEGWQIPRVAPDPELRRRLEDRAVAGGGAGLYRELAEVDPAAAQRISPHNIRRVIRALEVYRSTGVPFSQLKRKKKPPFRTLIIGLTAPRQELYRRVDLRVDDMMAQGLVAEVKGLLDMGYPLSLPAMSGIGYRQVGRFLKGELTLDEATRQIKTETHRFVRQQYAWFRPGDARIRWFAIGSEGVVGEIMDLVTQFTEAVTDEFCQASRRRE